MKQEIWHGDCLELMKNIADKSIDFICIDPPYGTTAAQWDKIVDFEFLWNSFNRILKPNKCACVW